MFGFGKKKDEFSFDGGGEHKENPFFSDPSHPAPSSFPEPAANPFAPSAFEAKSQFESSVGQKDIDLLSSKLDTIKAMLENVIQRLDRIEKEKAEPVRPEPRKWY